MVNQWDLDAFWCFVVIYNGWLTKNNIFELSEFSDNFENFLKIQNFLTISKIV